MSEPAARSEGFAFIAVESSTGLKHLMYSRHFEHHRWPPPIERTLCGRKVRFERGWVEITAEEWYVEPRQCHFCGGRVGPYATVKLGGQFSERNDAT